MHGNNPSSFFSRDEKEQIKQAIAKAENNTSGEIRLHLIRSFPKGMEPLEAGKQIFEKIGMTATKARNGILFILELKHHQLVILGDQGIHEKVEENFWAEIRDKVLEGFRKGDFAGGLKQGIELCGEKLKAHFPYQSGDINELPDEISHQD